MHLVLLLALCQTPDDTAKRLEELRAEVQRLEKIQSEQQLKALREELAELERFRNVETRIKAIQKQIQKLDPQPQKPPQKAEPQQTVWQPTPVQKAFYEAAMRRRAARGLPRQSMSQNCFRMAQEHAEFMARSYGHNHGVNDQIIAVGYSDYNGALGGWTGSPGHARWLYGNSDCVGFGYAESESGRPYYCGVYRDGPAEEVKYNPPGGRGGGGSFVTGRRSRRGMFRRRR